MTAAKLTLKGARRLALAAAGLLQPRLTGLPGRTSGSGGRALKASLALIEHFGYLQLDSVAVSGARTHAIVLGSRLAGLNAGLGETLLAPGVPLFEYWGHEASWIAMDLYPAFEFRRQEYRLHPWYGDVIGENRQLADELLDRIRLEGPLRSLDLEGEGRSGGWGSGKRSQRVLTALWSAGDVAISQRRNFQRVFDLSERVIPAALRAHPLAFEDALEQLLLKALDGHGWANSATLAATWRLQKKGAAIKAALARLQARGEVVPCTLETDSRSYSGWVKPQLLGLLPALERARPPRDKGVLLSPFDPLLWDRARAMLLFNFFQRLEIYKPAHERQYGYYCLPLLVGEHLMGRVDLKADRRAGALHTLSVHYEDESAAARRAMRGALERFADFVGLQLASR